MICNMDERRADDDRIRELLHEPEDIIVSWMLVARTAGMNRTGGLIILTDDDCDVITHMGLAAAAEADAKERVSSLAYMDTDLDEDDEDEIDGIDMGED